MAPDFSGKLCLPPGDVLCAISGGADSVALLRALCTLRDGGRRGGIVAAHVNHGLRGSESDGDEAFVRELCNRLGVAVTVRRCDAEGYRRQHRLGLEEAARNLRYSFLEEQCALWRCDYIATAHTQDDNLETLMLALVRGTGLRGLGGIPPRNGAVLRPMLDISRREVLGYLEALGQPYRSDASNDSDAMRRNRLRHSVVPLLAAENPEILAASSRTIRLLREDEDCLAGLVQGVWNEHVRTVSGGLAVPMTVLQDLHAALRSRLLRSMAEQAGTVLYGRQTDALLALCQPGQAGKSLDLGGGVTALRRQDSIFIGRKPDCITPIFTLVDAKPGDIRFCLRRNSLQGALVLRTRREGDAFQPSGRPAKTLKRWMSEFRIPREERDILCIATDEAGIVAVERLGVSRRCAPQPGGEKTMLHIKRIYHET